MVRTRSNKSFLLKNIVFPLLTLKPRVKVTKVKTKILSTYDKKILKKAIKPMNFHNADRCDVKLYADAIERKIRKINLFTNNGVNIFQTKFNFPLCFVYPLLVDFYHLTEDYLAIKDKFLYSQHKVASDYYEVQPEPDLDCDHCSFYSMVKSIETKRRQNYEAKKWEKNYGTHLYSKK